MLFPDTIHVSGLTQLPAKQADPCDHPHGAVGDATYCDRYWECVGNEAFLYDCPNGLVFVGRHRGIAEGCDYPWRGPYCQSGLRGEEKQLASKVFLTIGIKQVNVLSILVLRTADVLLEILVTSHRM